MINLLSEIKSQTFDSAKKYSNTQLDKKLIETTSENGNTTMKKRKLKKRKLGEKINTDNRTNRAIDNDKRDIK